MNKIEKEKIKHQFYKLRNYVYATLLLLGTVSADTKVNKPSAPKVNKDEFYYQSMVNAFNDGKCFTMEEFLENVPSVIDTIVINKDNYNARNCLGRYLSDKKYVEMKHFEADTTEASAYQKKRILGFVKHYNNPDNIRHSKIHEFKHLENHQKKFLEGEICPEDYARLCQHNEISATLASLVLQREIYKKNGDIKIFEPKFNEYKKAIEDGSINPHSTLWQDRVREQMFMARSVRDWWVEREQNNYKYSVASYVKHWFKKAKKPKSENSSYFAYKESLDKCYTYIMDGQLINLNFYSSYAIKDVDLNKHMTDVIAECRDSEKSNPKFKKFEQKNSKKSFSFSLASSKTR